MKITDAHGAYKQISQVNETSKIDRAEIAPNQKTDHKIEMPQDKISLSETSKDLQMAKDAAESASDIRMDRVNELKQAIAEGRYQVNPDKIAERILQEHASGSPR